MRVLGCQPQDSPPSRTDCSLISRVSCDEGGDCASCLPACLLGSAAESACCGLQTASVSNLLGEGLPAWTCDSPSTQESWQCQTRGPTEPPRPPCRGQQLTAGPRRDRWCPWPPPLRCCLVPLLTSIPLAPFPSMVVVGEGLWSPRSHSQALFLAPFGVQASRAVERAENEARTWPGEGRAGRVWLQSRQWRGQRMRQGLARGRQAGRVSLSRTGSAGPRRPAALPPILFLSE